MILTTPSRHSRSRRRTRFAAVLALLLPAVLTAPAAIGIALETATTISTRPIYLAYTNNTVGYLDTCG